jgi:23S rRNA (adenine2503-C2)-methyltransferase
VLALQALTDLDLCAAVPTLTAGQARALIAAIHRGRPLAPRPGLPRAALEAALARGAIPALTLLEYQASARDPFEKLLLATDDGHRIECVTMPLERPGRVSVCVSSQAGCALACAFCATGRLGLARNLASWEIVEQVRLARARLVADRRVHGVVFQGMGEPLANLERVAAAIRVLTAPYALAIDARAITVSTAGLPDGIRRLAALAPRVRLAVSIGSPHPDVRAELMPISRAHPLAEVLAATADHARATGLAPLWAMTLLAGVNDSADDARLLAGLARDFAVATGLAPRVSIIDYNPVAGAPFATSPATAAFRDELAAHGVRSHRRYSGGVDIAAACGQLVGARRAAGASRRPR